MKVNFPSFYISPLFCAPPVQKAPRYTINQGFDVFEKSANKNISFCGEYKNNFGIDKENVKNLSEAKYNLLSEKCKKMAQDTVEMSVALKEGLDDKYGEGNYVFVSIGTSPSGVGKALELMGQDVRYVPISGIHNSGSSSKAKRDMLQNKDRYKYDEYMNSVGISADKVNYDKRKYVFCDYTDKGMTLDVMRTYITNALNISPYKCDFMSLNYTLVDDARKKGDMELVHVFEGYVKEHFFYSGIDNYSGIPHLSYNELGKIDEVSNQEKTKKAKDFEYALAYNLWERGILTET